MSMTTEVKGKEGKEEREKIREPTNLEVTAAKPRPQPIRIEDAPSATKYQSLQPINLGEVGYGPIPITNVLDETGYRIGEDDLKIARERTELLKQVVVTATGDRNPLPIGPKSPRRSPKAANYHSPGKAPYSYFGEATGFGMGGLTQSPSAKKLLQMTQGQRTEQPDHERDDKRAEEPFKLVVITDSNPNQSIEAARGRKSPFDSINTVAP